MKTAAAILALSVLAAAFTAPSARADQILSYQFSPDASMTVSGKTFAISGTFGYDVNTERGVNLDITYTDGANSETFTEYCAGLCGVANTNISNPEALAYIGTTSSPDFIGLSFNSSLALDEVDTLDVLSPDDIQSGCNCDALAKVADTASAVTGTVDPVSSVPEPASLALLASGLVGFGVSRRRKRKTV